MHHLAPLRLAPAPVPEPPSSPVSTSPNSPTHHLWLPSLPPTASRATATATCARPVAAATAGVGVPPTTTALSSSSSSSHPTVPAAPALAPVPAPGTTITSTATSTSSAIRRSSTATTTTTTTTTTASAATPKVARRPKRKPRPHKPRIPGESRYWTPSEHRLFVEALVKFGPKDLKSIAAHVGTRNMIQCRTHEQKYFLRLMRMAMRDAPPILYPSPTSHPPSGPAGNTNSNTSRGTTDRPAQCGTPSTSCSSSITTPQQQRQQVHQHSANVVPGSTTASSGPGFPPQGNPAPSGGNGKPDKVVYSLPSSCGLSLLCAVGEEMQMVLEQ